MLRERKKEVVSSLVERLSGSDLVIVINYQGMTVEKMQGLRKNIIEEGGHFAVAKNTLMKIAISSLGDKYSSIQGLFSGPTAVAYGDSNNAPSIAKIMSQYAKDLKCVSIIGGALLVKVLDEQDVKDLASLPSLDELRGKIIGLVNAPAQSVARVLSVPAVSVVNVLNAYSEQ